MGLTYGELFAGAGGLSLGLHRTGFECRFHAEIDSFARRILETRFPGVPLYGDVVELDGAQLVAECGKIDLLSGGSPCQDLSQAGRRAGILEGERSNLFFQQIRLWQETGAPFLLWENVHGALSSQGGEDFRYVLSAIVGADVGRAVDKRGKVKRWAKSGVVLGPKGRAAWRVMDAQHWGPPQHRRRVFILAARPGNPSPAEILFECEGVSGGAAASPTAKENIAGGARSVIAQAGGAGADRPDSSEGHSRIGAVIFDSKQSGESHENVAPTLRAMNFDKSHLNGGGQLAVVTHDKPDPVETRVARLVAFGAYVEDGTASALKARDYKDHTDLIYVYHNGRYGAPRRLMPIECERLMDWQAVNERGWTEIDDGNGKVAADSHRYRACGNGVVSACVEWIGLRLRDALMHHRVGLSR